MPARIRPRVERRIAEKDHCGLAACPCYIERGSNERRADALALAGWHHADRAERDHSVLADPRAAELDVPDEITVVVGDKGERPIVIAQSLDDGCLFFGAKGKPFDLDRSVSVRGPLGSDFDAHWAPVEPKPPSPRVVGGSSSPHSAASSGTATTTS